MTTKNKVLLLILVAIVAFELLVQIERFSRLNPHTFKKDDTISETSSKYNELRKTLKEIGYEELDYNSYQATDDIYKTYGRLGEIALRSGNYNEAIKYFENSINEQKNTFGDDNIEGRNICYLANAKLLNNELEEAENLYKETQILDNKENKINLYAELGLFAVALRKATDKQSIIEQILNILNNIENKKTVGDNLPKALIKFVLFKLDSEQYNNYATEIIDDLIKDNYYIDALACLPYIFNNVDNNIKYYFS